MAPVGTFSKAEITASYVSKFPQSPNLTLARLIFLENPGLFVDIEQTRSSVRYVRGNMGQLHRTRNAYKALHVPSHKNDPYDDIPDGDMEDWTPVPIESARTLCLFDLHVPYHDKKSLRLAVDHGKDRGVDGILIQEGLDCYHLSDFVKDPRKRSFKDELDVLNDTIYTIQKITGAKRTYYQLGNHERRWARFLMTRGVAILGMEFTKWHNLIDRSLHVTVIEDQKIAKAGKLNIVHGDEFGSGSFEPVNPARGLFLRGHECCMAGHWHRTSSHTETSMNGTVIANWTVGCLCDLHPQYRRINKWNHGFAEIDLFKDGNFMVNNYRIINGKVFA